MDTSNDRPPTSGIIMCVRCNLPARDCEHSPLNPVADWLNRAEANGLIPSPEQSEEQYRANR